MTTQRQMERQVEGVAQEVTVNARDSPDIADVQEQRF